MAFPALYDRIYSLREETGNWRGLERHYPFRQGELLEVRGKQLGELQVYDHRLERAVYVRESEARIIATTEADAPQLLAVLRFLQRHTAKVWGASPRNLAAAV